MSSRTRIITRCSLAGIALAACFVALLAACKVEVKDAPATATTQPAAQPVAQPATQPARTTVNVSRAGDVHVHVPPAVEAQGYVEVRPDGTIISRGGVPVEVVEEGNRTDVRPSVARHDTARAAGPGLAVSGQEAKIEQEGKAPHVSLGAVGEGGVEGGASTGDGGASKTSAKVAGIDQGAMSLYVMGGLAFLAGCVAIGGLGMRGMGLCLMAGGVGLIALGSVCTNYPWLPPVAIGVVLVAGFVWHMLDAHAAAKTGEALRAVVRGVESVATKDPATGQAVKDDIGQAVAVTAGARAESVRDTIRKAKRKAGV